MSIGRRSANNSSAGSMLTVSPIGGKCQASTGHLRTKPRRTRRSARPVGFFKFAMAVIASVENTLKKARKQLPDRMPGIVFVKVPPRWIADPQSVAAMLDVARSFLHGTRRVVSVKFYSSPISFSDNMLRHDHAYKELSNPVTDFGNDMDWSIFKKHILPPKMKVCRRIGSASFSFPMESRDEDR